MCTTTVRTHRTISLRIRQKNLWSSFVYGCSHILVERICVIAVMHTILLVLKNQQNCIRFTHIMGMWVKLWNSRIDYSVVASRDLANRFFDSMFEWKNLSASLVKYLYSPPEVTQWNLPRWLMFCNILCKPPWNSAMHYTDIKFKCKSFCRIDFRGRNTEETGWFFGRKNQPVFRNYLYILSAFLSIYVLPFFLLQTKRKPREAKAFWVFGERCY